MLNHFREPQKAVLSIQQDLDDTGPRAALFIDMAKAFEKVNPHWAVDVMLARGCPTWLVQYAMYLFTGRRVVHKVGGQLLPPRITRQGVDMGRAFSVFMFCLAMIPSIGTSTKFQASSTSKAMSMTAPPLANVGTTWPGYYRCDVCSTICTQPASRSSSTAAGRPA